MQELSRVKQTRNSPDLSYHIGKLNNVAMSGELSHVHLLSGLLFVAVQVEQAGAGTWKPHPDKNTHTQTEGDKQKK